VEYPNVLSLGGNEQVPLFVVVEDQGVALYDGEAWTRLTSADGLPSDEIIDALLTGDDLWVSSDAGLGRIDLQTREVETFPHTGIYGMHQSSDGMIWFRGLGHALRYDADTGDWQEFEREPGTLPYGQVTDPVDDGNRVWWGTYGDGVTWSDGSQWETWRTDERLGGNLIEAIRQESDGVLWFLHPGTGLTRHEPAGDKWQVFDQANGALDWPGIHDLDSDGTVWIGEFGELRRYDGQRWQTFTAAELTDVEIYAIEIGPGDVKWIMTDRGLMRHDPVSNEWTMFTAADHPLIGGAPSLLAASDGTLWLGAEEGLVSWDGREWSTPGEPGDAPQFVGDLAEAPDGSLWVAVGDQLAHFADGQWSYSDAPSGGWLVTVAVGPDGHVWAGGEGLGRFDPATGWLFYTVSDGLVHRLVRAIQVTPEGVVWIGTEGGVSRFAPQD
jgi:ligand-binding sensor domain-containing protein